MNQLPLSKRAAILSLLVEGNSLRSVERIAGVSINTISKLLVEIGTACQEFQDKRLRNLWLSRLQLDELWSFVGAKTRAKSQTFYGDVWTFVALCPDTKLLLCYKIGKRSDKVTQSLIDDIDSRLAAKVQITTDGYPGYEIAIKKMKFADYGKVVKEYAYTNYKPGDGINCVDIHKMVVQGNPDESKISTSHVERYNLTIRRTNARYARQTNAHSKKLENHKLAFALHAVHYNWCRVHQTIKMTPAMAVGLTDRVWTLEDLLHL